MKAVWSRYRADVLVAGVLLALALALFLPQTFGGKTLLPVDNLFQWQPWQSFAAEYGISVPHNALLSDLILENYVWKRFILESLHQPGGLTDKLPLWNPQLFAGVPFLAAGQHSALYPFSILFYILPLAQAYGWFSALQLFLAGLFTYVFCRVIDINRFGSLLAGVTFMLSGFMVVSVVFTMIIAAAAWLPLLLATVELIVRAEKDGFQRRTLLYVALGAIALGCQILAGHAEITYYTLLIVAVYALWRLAGTAIDFRSRVHTPRIVAWLALLLLVGLALGAAQLVPLYEVGSQNFRQGSATYEQILSWAFPPRQLATFFVPNFYGSPAHHGYFDIFEWRWLPVTVNAHAEPIAQISWQRNLVTKNYVEAGSYLGILPYFLAVVALFGRRGRYHSWDAHFYRVTRRYVWFFALLAFLSLSFVFGTPLYALIYRLPFIGQLHSPFRWIFPFSLSLAVLAGMGAMYLAGGGKRTTSAQSTFTGPNTQRLLGWPAFWAGLAGVMALLSVWLFRQPLLRLADAYVQNNELAALAFRDGAMLISYQWRNLLVFFLMLAASGAILRLSRCPIYLPRRLGGGSAWKVLALAVLVIDLFLFGMGFNPAVEARLLDFRPPVVDFLLADDSLYRITSYNAPGENTFNANAGMFYGLHDIRGYDSIIPRQYTAYMQLVSPQNQLPYNRIAPLWTDHPQALDSPLLDMLGVKYVLTTQAIDNPRYTLAYDGEIRVYRNQGAMPRAFSLPAGCAVAVQDVAQALQRYDPRNYVILETTVDVPPLPQLAPDACQPQAATVSLYKANEVFIDLHLDTAAWLVLSDTYFPGWKAFVRPLGDASEAHESELTIHRADGHFRAVRLEAGAHTVRFKYTPESVKVGFFVSFLGAMALLMLLALWLWRRFYRMAGRQSDAGRVAKNSFAPTVLQLFNKAIDMAFIALALRIFTQDQAGDYDFVTSYVIMSVSIFLDFGLNTLLQRQISRDRDLGNRYLINAVLLRGLLSAVVAPLLFAFVVGWGAAIEPLSREAIGAMALFTIGLFVGNVSGALTALFNAYEEMEFPAAVTTVTTIARAALGTGALLLGWGLMGLGGVSIVVNLITASILAGLAVRRYFRPHWQPDLALQKEMLRESAPLMVNNLLSWQFFRIDKALMKALRGAAELGRYTAVSFRIVDAINIIPASFTIALFPLMSRYAAATKDSLARAYVLAVQVLWIVALPLVVVITRLAHPLANLLGGSQYLPDSAIALQLLVWSIPLGFINSVTHYVLIALNEQRYLTRCFLIGLVFTFVANLVLIPAYGYRAAAVLHLFSELALLIPFYIGLRRHLPPVPWPKLLWRPAAAAAGMAAPLLLAPAWPIWLTLALGGLVYLVLLFALNTFRDESWQPVLDALPQSLARIPGWRKT
ncbi:MAG: oligosaccharide flippase family protein [Chloroflexota bacterium]